MPHLLWRSCPGDLKCQVPGMLSHHQQKPREYLQEEQRQPSVLSSLVSLSPPPIFRPPPNTIDGWSSKATLVSTVEFLKTKLSHLPPGFCWSEWYWRWQLNNIIQQQLLRPVTAGPACCRHYCPNITSATFISKTVTAWMRHPRLGSVAIDVPCRRCQWGSQDCHLSFQPSTSPPRQMYVFCLITHGLVVSGVARIYKPWKANLRSFHLCYDFLVVLLIWGHPYSCK